MKIKTNIPAGRYPHLSQMGRRQIKIQTLGSYRGPDGVRKGPGRGQTGVGAQVGSDLSTPMPAWQKGIPISDRLGGVSYPNQGYPLPSQMGVLPSPPDEGSPYQLGIPPGWDLWQDWGYPLGKGPDTSHWAPLERTLDQWLEVLWDGMGYQRPHEQTDACENSTFPS